MEQKKLKSFKYLHRRYKLDKENCKNYTNLTENLYEKNKTQLISYLTKQVTIEDEQKNRVPFSLLPQKINQRKNTFKIISKQVSNREFLNVTLDNQIKYKTQDRLSIPKVEIKKQYYKNSSIFPPQLFYETLINQHYVLQNQIGKGSYASVYLATSKLNSQKYAIKIYDKNALRLPHRLQNIKRQVKNLKHLSHNNIISLINSIHDSKKVYLVMQFAGKNSMYSILKKRQNRRYSEAEGKRYFQQLLEALSYCHKKKVYHRDIKLQNILINDDDNLKLIDFGFSVVSKDKLSSFCGTPSYMAPQIISKINYEGQYVDIWACGVLLYVMLYGTYPFKATDQNELFKKIKTGKFVYKQGIKISEEGRKVIQKMLKLIPSNRCTAQELLLDPWFQ